MLIRAAHSRIPSADWKPALHIALFSPRNSGELYTFSFVSLCFIISTPGTSSHGPRLKMRVETASFFVLSDTLTGRAGIDPPFKGRGHVTPSPSPSTHLNSTTSTGRNSLSSLLLSGHLDSLAFTLLTPFPRYANKSFWIVIFSL
jgi:hypothetical protein